MKFVAETIAIVFIIAVLVFAFLSTSTQTSNHATMPVSVYIIDDQNGYFSSTRSSSDVEFLFDEANRIWAQGNITLQITSIERVSIDYPRFIENLYSRTPNFDDLPRNPDTINGYFVNSIEPNGVALFSSRSFMVKDVTSVNSFRTLAHEVGHLLTLQHVADQNNLMASGVNGEQLTPSQIAAARQSIKRDS